MPPKDTALIVRADEVTLTKTGNVMSIKNGGVPLTGIVSRAASTPKSAFACWDGGGNFAPLTGVRGEIPFWTTSGVVSNIATGTSGQFLKTNGANADPTWASAPTATYSGRSGINTDTHGFGATGFLGHGSNLFRADETYANTIAPTATVLTNFYTNLTENSVNGNTTITLRVNGVDSNLQVVYSTGETGNKTDTGSATIAAGDLISVSVVTAGSSGTIGRLRFAAA